VITLGGIVPIQDRIEVHGAVTGPCLDRRRLGARPHRQLNFGQPNFGQLTFGQRLPRGGR
jgi:hypothetical protein